MDEIVKWCHDNGLVVNASKTKILHIKPQHLIAKDINIIFHVDNCLHNQIHIDHREACTTKIEVVKTYKYLGVYVDENFKWLTHIQNISKKLKKAAYSLYHLSNCTHYEVLKQAYLALAEPYIRHGITAWGNSTYCKSLQQTQNRILKILIKNKHYNQQQLHTSPVYNNNFNIINSINNTISISSNNNLNNSNNNISNNNSNNYNNSNNNKSNNNSPNNNVTNNNNVDNNIPNNNSNINSPVNNSNNNNSNNNSRNNNSNNNIPNNNVPNYNHSNINSPINNSNNNNPSNNSNNNNSSNNSLHNNISNHKISNNNVANTNNNNSSNNNNSNNSNNYNTKNNTNLATELQILNVKSIYEITLINEFCNDNNFLTPIDHHYNTRRRAEGRYKVERFRNNYGKNTLKVSLPNILNKIPISIMSIQNPFKRKYCIKNLYLNSQ